MMMVELEEESLATPDQGSADFAERSSATAIRLVMVLHSIFVPLSRRQCQDKLKVS